MGDNVFNVIFPEHRKGLINMTVLLPLCLQEGWREKCAGVSVWKNTPKGGFTAPLQLWRDFTVGIRPCSVLRRGLGAWGVWGWPCLGSYYWCILVSLVNLTHLGRETINWRTVSKEWSVGISHDGIFMIDNWCRKVQSTMGSAIPRQVGLDCKKKKKVAKCDPGRY